MQQVALVTGGTRGIGRAIVERFAADGFAVAVVGTRKEGAEKVAGELREAHGVEAEGFGCDVGDCEAAEAMVAAVIERFGRVDALVNNAGITRDGLLLRMKPEDWDDVLRVNLTGAFHTCKAAARQLLRQKGGAVVNVSSVVGLTGNAGQANYAASKAGLIGFTKSLARELATKGVRANVVAPGYIQTDMTAELGDKVKEELEAKIPIKRLGVPEDIAGVVRFLCSDDAKYITGQVLPVDGGMVT
jgi:3-oxoacyl-[acyl-carrier protein] reductase